MKQKHNKTENIETNWRWLDFLLFQVIDVRVHMMTQFQFRIQMRALKAKSFLHSIQLIVREKSNSFQIPLATSVHCTECRCALMKNLDIHTSSDIDVKARGKKRPRQTESYTSLIVTTSRSLIWAEQFSGSLVWIAILRALSHWTAQACRKQILSKLRFVNF